MKKRHTYLHIPEKSLRAGDIILFHGRGIFSHLIQWATNSYWSHSALVDRVRGKNMVELIESSGHGVRPINLDSYKDRPKLVIRPNCSPEIAHAAVWEAIKLGDFAYDWPFVIKMALSKLLNKKLAIKENHKMVCSELVVEAYKKAGVKLLSPGEIPTPAAIAKHRNGYIIYGPDID